MRPLFSFLLALFILGAQPTTRNAALQYDHGGIIRGDVTQNRLTLIVTGGEYAEGVETILNVCAEEKIPAHFFVTGDFLRLHAKEARSIIAAGQPLGPHGDAHLLSCEWGDREKSLVTREQFRADLQKNRADLKALGAPPGNYFVPPFEWYNDQQAEWSRELGLTLINFTPGSGSNRDYIPESDAKFVSSIRLKDDILRFEATADHGLNGFILLLHAGSQRQDKMHDQLEPLVREIKARGYRFVTLDELFSRS